ncbi:MAG: UDP-2,3-diacylglucosamine diphosphatase [Bauldia sp.]|nr:UDP-2,3-diacylglucosamine diphosphatase [Bauldia sp.]
MPHRPSPVRYRTIFLSDIHLGTRGCKAERLLDFLARHDSSTIYLVGDVVDGWKLRHGWYFPPSHSEVIQVLLTRAKNGTRVVYVPGNHDEFVRPYVGHMFGSVEVLDRIIHETADGRRLLVLHGDQFDVVLRWARWASLLGSVLYNALLAANGIVNRVRRLFGGSGWSLSDWAKRTIKGAVNFIGDYEKSLVEEAARAGADGIVCGHIHHAAIDDRLGIAYVNTGDWMESCTAVVEHFDGRMELIRWTEEHVAAASGERAGRSAESAPALSDMTA